MFDKPKAFESRDIPEIFSGTPTFLGLPKAKTEKDLNQYDVAFLGTPWEGVVTWGGFSSCELATKSIRNASVRYGGYLPEFDLDVFDYFKGVDFGDCPVDSSSILRTNSYIEEKLRSIISADTFPVVFGGDHSVSYPIVKQLAQKHNGKVGVIHFDSHMDNLAGYQSYEHARCTPLYNIYNIEGLNPQNIVHLGIRGPRNQPEGIQTAREMGTKVLTMFDIHKMGLDKAIETAVKTAKQDTEAVYVTVCSDILDAAFNPGGPPDVAGLSSYELAYFLHEIAKSGIEGFDFLEVYPLSDPNDISSHTAVWMIMYVLSGLVKHRFSV